jgi:hypothetical protein
VDKGVPHKVFFFLVWGVGGEGKGGVDARIKCGSMWERTGEHIENMKTSWELVIEHCKAPSFRTAWDG